MPIRAAPWVCLLLERVKPGEHRDFPPASHDELSTLPAIPMRDAGLGVKVGDPLLHKERRPTGPPFANYDW